MEESGNIQITNNLKVLSTSGQIWEKIPCSKMLLTPDSEKKNYIQKMKSGQEQFVYM